MYQVIQGIKDRIMGRLHREINLNLQQNIKHGYSSDLEFLHQVMFLSHNGFTT